MSQKDALAFFMRRGFVVDSDIALRRFKMRRLSARIYDLRADGHVIRTRRRNGLVVYWMAARTAAR